MSVSLEEQQRVDREATFSTLARAAVFYDVHTGEVRAGLKFLCELEPFYTKNRNTVVLKRGPASTLEHLTREA